MSEKALPDSQPDMDRLIKCEFLYEPDSEFSQFVQQLPAKHWSKYDLSAVRMGWEAYKTLHSS